MDRNTTIAFILIGLILVVWLYMNAPEPVKQEGKTQDTTTVVTDSLKEKQVTDKTKKTVEKTPPKTVKKETVDYGKFFKSQNEKTKITTIESDDFIIELSSKGGNFRKIFLKKYKNWYSVNGNGNNDYYKTSVQLINYKMGNTYDLSFVSADGKAINTANLFFKPDLMRAKYSVSGKDSLILNYTLEENNGSKIVKRYIFYGDKYIIKSDIELINMNSIISNSSYDLVWSNGIRFVEKNTVDEATYSNASVFSGGEQVIIDASSVDEVEKKDFNGSVDWMAVRDKYFAAIVIPDNPHEVEGAYVEGYSKVLGKEGKAEYYNSRLILPFKGTNHEKNSFIIYVGPVDYTTLKDLGHNLQALVDFGSFFGLTFIIRPIAEYIMLPLFNFLHLFIPNYGFVILVFSIIIKIVVYPLTKQSYQSMKKMQLLQPKIAEIKEKYKDDAQKLNKETMKLYQTYGVNPAGGCLPMLLQMPIFIALWGLFRTAIELRQQPFILWIKDLSQPDVIYNLGFKLPLFGIQEISGLAILMGITTFIQQKMTMKDPKQQSMVYIMPVFLTILFMSFPSGLNLYYFLFNFLSILQQQYINHKHDGLELVPVKNPKKKKGFMSKLMEAAEQQQKTQQKKRR